MKPWRHWLLAFGVSTLLNFSANGAGDHEHKAGGELKHGRYIGWIRLTDTGERIATVADFFLESPEDLTQFPRLNAIFKLSLGGYNTHEYVTELFENLRYDFDNGALTFDSPKNDLMMTTEVHQVGSKTKIMGQVLVRSSAVFGTVELTLESDEPEDDEDGEPGTEEAGPFVPLLSGQYEGTCENDKRAMIQIQTVRGLKTIWQGETDTNSLGRYYGIVGRLAYKNSLMCGDLGPRTWCTLYNFGGGSYNLFLGKLNLHGARASEECGLRKGELTCRIRVQGKSFDCKMKRTDAGIQPAKFFPRKYHVSATSAQKEELPPADPPKNKELLEAVRGTFSGYLHNETNDTYQLVRLNALPFNFSDNPHNPNQMMVTTTAAMHLERTKEGPFSTQRYEPRSFYIRPGFTLAGPSTDSFIDIVEWKRGYARGIWYSHAFGKVGTVQLVKGEAPPFPSGAKVLKSFAGEFGGPVAPDGTVAKLRWFKFLFPAQPTDLTEHLIRYTGSYQPVVGITGVHDIERGTFDPYTGLFGWVITRGEAATFSHGVVADDGDIKMYWPPAPDIFGAQTADYRYETFRRQETNP